MRMIWDEELETEMGSNGTEGTAWVGKRHRSLHCPAKSGTSTGKFPFLWESSVPWHPAGSSRLGWMILELSSSPNGSYTRPHELGRRGAHRHHLESQPWFRNSFQPKQGSEEFPGYGTSPTTPRQNCLGLVWPQERAALTRGVGLHVDDLALGAVRPPLVGEGDQGFHKHCILCPGLQPPQQPPWLSLGFGLV